MSLGHEPPVPKGKKVQEEDKDTKVFFDAEMKRVKQRSKNIVRSISGRGLENSILGSIGGALKGALSPVKKRSKRPGKVLSLAHQETF